MTTRRTTPQRPAWSGLCPTCHAPLTETRRDETSDGARLTYTCAVARAEEEPWPHVPLLRWKEGATHTTCSTWMIDADETGQPRPGSMIVESRFPPHPTTADEATAAYHEATVQRDQFYKLLARIALNIVQRQIERARDEVLYERQVLDRTDELPPPCPVCASPLVSLRVAVADGKEWKIYECPAAHGEFERWLKHQLRCRPDARHGVHRTWRRIPVPVDGSEAPGQPGQKRRRGRQTHQLRWVVLTYTPPQSDEDARRRDEEVEEAYHRIMADKTASRGTTAADTEPA